ncbi:MAG: hypothetical protein ACOX5R_19100 [bacterium]|jgi:hypothetical protein
MSKNDLLREKVDKQQKFNRLKHPIFAWGQRGQGQPLLWSTPGFRRSRQ